MTTVTNFFDLVIFPEFIFSHFSNTGAFFQKIREMTMFAIFLSFCHFTKFFLLEKTVKGDSKDFLSYDFQPYLLPILGSRMYWKTYTSSVRSWQSSLS